MSNSTPNPKTEDPPKPRYWFQCPLEEWHLTDVIDAAIMFCQNPDKPGTKPRPKHITANVLRLLDKAGWDVVKREVAR